MFHVISIHAPREGSDRDSRAADVLASLFLSTLPARGATEKFEILPVEIKQFLSTLPARGATLWGHGQHFSVQYFYPRSPRGERPAKQPVGVCQRHISIHAPREGSDLQNSQFEFANAIFLSTLPARGATSSSAQQSTSAGQISIHAPREGSDQSHDPVDDLRRYFYPRSPRGERLKIPDLKVLKRIFLSTLPARGATRCTTISRAASLFLSTLPARGATANVLKNKRLPSAAFV